MNPENWSPQEDEDEYEYFAYERLQHIVQLQQLYFLRQNSFSFSNDPRIPRTTEGEDHYGAIISQQRATSPKANQIQQKYMNLRKRNRSPNQTQSGESYIKVTVLKNMAFQNNPSQEYYINSRGLIGSKKNTDINDIMIGRQMKTLSPTGEEVYPNDIVLAENERIISRVHCKLITKNFFSSERRIRFLYISTLRSLHLPVHVISLLGSFLQEPMDILVQDIASGCGTHQRISSQIGHCVRQSQMYTIGSETTFTIEDIHIPSADHKEYSFEYGYILSVLMDKRYEIHGLSQHERASIKSHKDYASLQDAPLNMLKAFKRAFVVMKFTGQGVAENKSLHIFLANWDENSTDFVIGRGQDNHVKLQSNTISRKQTRFMFDKLKCQWLIFDGALDRDSANGTWVSLSTYQQRLEKSESSEVALRNRVTEIKISDFILKIELHNKKYPISQSRKTLKYDQKFVEALLK